MLPLASPDEIRNDAAVTGRILHESEPTEKKEIPIMDALEKGYRAWWAKHTAAERAELQQLDGYQNPREVLDVIENSEGIPLAAGMVDNPDHGSVTLPGYVLTWDPNDDHPTTQTDEDE